MAILSVPSVSICPYRLPRVGYWQFPGVPVCKPGVDIKKGLPTNFVRTLFLEHTSYHSGSISVFADGFKYDTCVGIGVVFPEFCRGSSLPVVDSGFTSNFYFSC